MSKQEEWRPIPYRSDYYEVSNCGRVKGGGKLLKLALGKTGYVQVRLSNQGAAKTFKIHRLVAQAFIGPCPEGLQVAHLDGRKINNHVENLTYCTAKENSGHRYIHGTHLSCEAHGSSKLTNEQVRELRREYRPRCPIYGAKAMARKYGIHHVTVSKIITGLRWQHLSEEPRP